MAKRRNKGQERGIATARMRQLMSKAEVEATGPDADLAPRYVAMARRVGMKYQMGLPRAAKAITCRTCNNLRNAANGRTRIRSGRIIYTCNCGAMSRRPLAPRAQREKP